MSDVAKYSDDQPRADNGEWSSGGGGSDDSKLNPSGERAGGASMSPSNADSPKEWAVMLQQHAGADTFHAVAQGMKDKLSAAQVKQATKELVGPRHGRDRRRCGNRRHA